MHLQIQAGQRNGDAGRWQAATMALTSLAAVAILFSIAVSQIFLGAAVLALLLSRQKLQFPARPGFALLAFLGWTLVSLAFSGDPMAGVSSVRKLFTFLIPLVVYNAYRHRGPIWRTLQAVVVGGTLAALYGLGEFIQKYFDLKSQGLAFYEHYVAHQITGFMSHWMTFSGQLMMALLLLLSMLLFRREEKLAPWGWLCALLIGLGLLAAFTRGIWLAAFVGVVYLLASSYRRVLWLLPVAVLVVYLVSPSWLQRRQLSILDTETDSSNQARLVMLRTGLRMIAAHPWFGVGPEQVGAEFLRYKPAELPLPHAWYGHLHNSYLQIAAERGIPCLALWLWVLWEVLRETWLLRKNSSQQARVLGHAGFAITLAMMVASAFEFNFGDSEVLILLLFIIAFAFGWRKLEGRDTPAQPLATVESST